MSVIPSKELEQNVSSAFSAMADRKNTVELVLRIKPDHAIEILKVLEVLQKNG